MRAQNTPAAQIRIREPETYELHCEHRSRTLTLQYDDDDDDDTKTDIVVV